MRVLRKVFLLTAQSAQQSNKLSLSCHVVVPEETSTQGGSVRRAVAELVRDDYGIAHTTIQVETGTCDRDEPDCTMRTAGEPHDVPQHP